MNTNDLKIIIAKMSHKKISVNDLIDILALMMYSKLSEEDIKRLKVKMVNNTKEN